MAKDSAQRDRSTDLGVVRISNDAIATIASTAALEVKGVAKMGCGGSMPLSELFCKCFPRRGVRIKMRDSEVKLTVCIVVEYGIDIPRVADEVQENVKRAVEKMAGLVLAEVDVVVEGVRAYAGAEKGRKA